MQDQFIKKSIEFRHHLHKEAELSGDERKTTQYIKSALSDLENSTSVVLNSYGVISTFQSQAQGPIIMIRGDIDALPIEDKIDASYKSTNEGIGHKCGHDGHSAILYLLAMQLNENPPETGTVHLLFQPSEENGKGAAKVLKDKNFTIDPDYVFALHNLPSYKASSIIINKDVFSSSVISCKITISGNTAHAAEPENADSPTPFLQELLNSVEHRENHNTDSEKYFIATPIYISIGEKNYGITPGKGEVHFTLRAYSNGVLDKHKKWFSEKQDEIAQKFNLKTDLSWLEEFRATENDTEAVNTVVTSAEKLKLSLITREKPFTWGEDFGLFTEKYNGAMFGLGAGENRPALHHPAYDFNDNIIKTGMKIFHEIIKRICSEMVEAPHS